MIDMFSFKDFNNCVLRATSTIKIGNKIFEDGEVVACFDKIQIGGLNEVKKRIAATGGFDNRALVFWETTQSAQLAFTQGVFSKEQFSILNNADVIYNDEQQGTLISVIEYLESDENGDITLKYTPAQNLFIYSKNSGEKLEYQFNNNIVKIQSAYLDVVVQYQSFYNSGAHIYRIGKNLTNGFFEFEGRTAIKDDKTGVIYTGVIKLPKIKLLSDLSLTLGQQANYNIANFQAMALPVGARNDSYVCEFYLMDSYID